MKHRLIFKTSLGDEVFYLNDTVLVNFSVGRNVVSTSKLNGGISNNLKSVFNHHLSQENIDYLTDHDVCEYLRKHCRQLNIASEFSTGLITKALMNNTGIVEKRFKSLEVVAITTAGVRTNASKAGDPASYYEENGRFGTINTIVLTNVCLSDETLLEAFMTATEAKAVALSDLKVPSQYSNDYATGTGTDGLIICSNLDSSNHLTNAGKHSKLGELIAKCVTESVKQAVKKQVWISPKSQSNALVRLNRYNLDINEFYDSLDCDKETFIAELQKDMKRQDNVAVTATVLNIIDEVRLDLIKKEDAWKLANKIVKENCNSYPIGELLQYWISHFIR